MGAMKSRRQPVHSPSVETETGSGVVDIIMVVVLVVLMVAVDRKNRPARW
jgi:hypothetical protein